MTEMDDNNTAVSSLFRMSPEERTFCSWVRLLLNCGLGGTICILGIIGNIVAFIVLNKGRSNTPVATFLLRCLALTDNFYLIVWLINFSFKDLFRYVKHYSTTWRYIRLYSFPTVYIAQMATIWLTVFIAAARFIAVCKPYLARRLCTIANMKLAVLGLYLIVLIYNLPRFFEVELEVKNGTVWFVDTWLGGNSSYQYIYNEVLYYVFSFGLPLLFLLVLNFRLTMAYQAVKKKRRRMRGMTTRSQQDDANITLVMIVVVAVFVVCQAPGRIAQIIWKYEFGSCRTGPFYIMEMATILEVVNSSVNFLIYCVVRPVFRTNFVITFCRSEWDDHNYSQTGMLMAVTQNGVVENKTSSVNVESTRAKISPDEEEIKQAEPLVTQSLTKS